MCPTTPAMHITVTYSPNKKHPAAPTTADIANAAHSGLVLDGFSVQTVEVQLPTPT
jgi:hypothetical protein